MLFEKHDNIENINITFANKKLKNNNNKLIIDYKSEMNEWNEINLFSV